MHAFDADKVDRIVATVAGAATWLEDRELGILFEYEGSARFYPLRILTSHEVVNDVINGFPYVVNYCPLCQTDGKVLADRSLSRLLKEDWPKTVEELEGFRS